MKKKSVLALIAVLTLGLTACGGDKPAEESETCHIGNEPGSCHQ